MSIVEMQTLVPSTFPITDSHSVQPTSYLDHTQLQSQYTDRRSSLTETRSPPSERPGLCHAASPHSSPGREASKAVHLDSQQSPQGAIAGKKRTANGQVKEGQSSGKNASTLTQTGRSRASSSVSAASNVTMVELSQQLRTRLTYAMIKVQNGWQHRSLDEVESLASASPRSTVFNQYSLDQHLLSPRAAMSARLQRNDSDSSSDESSRSQQYQPRPPPGQMSPPAKKGLAPPANIVPRSSQQRRRPPQNMHVETGLKALSPARPAIKYRTASQNAAMEADAVETLLFMASPNHSGHQSQFSPVTSAPSVNHFPSQTSPLRNTFSLPVSPKRVAFDANCEYEARYERDKNALVASVFEKLDDDESGDLDAALNAMDRHHATKITT